jgi:hypothetical protein
MIFGVTFVDRYCQHQIRDITAVSTGLRPLRVREKDTLKQRTATQTRADEWGKGGRAPLLTAEHRLPAKPHTASLTGETIDDVHASTPPHIKMREDIIKGNGIATHGIM